MFVKGQKLIWVEYDGFVKGNIGRIVTFSDYYYKNDREYVCIEEETGVFFSERFRTIVRSIDDIIKGMWLTIVDISIDDSPYGFNDSYKNKKFKVMRIDGNNIWLNCYSADPFKLRDFQEYKSEEILKEKEMKEYEVIKSFTILDIYNYNICRYNFKEFIEDCLDIDPHNMSEPFESFETIKYYPSLMSNLSSLKRSGFIKEINKDVKLELGMKLKRENSNNKYILIKNTANRLCLMKQENYIIFDLNYNLKEGMTLSELNKLSPYKYEVVDE